jgi:ketosteroid isomerase-like protein
MTSTPSDVERAAETTRRYRTAVEAGDLDGFLATLAPDVVLHSPITLRTDFRGHDEIRDLMRAVFASIEDIRYHADVGDAATRALFYRAHVGRQHVEEATLVRLDTDALVHEITLWFRPLPGLTAVMGALGPRLARQHGRTRAALVGGLVAPLVAATRAGDALAVSLVKPGGRSQSDASRARP